MEAKFFFILLSFAVVSASFSGSEDRIIRKYAMMKVYESCFGPEVVDEVKKEMREACLKCAGGMEAPPPPPPMPQQLPMHMMPAPPTPVAAPSTDEAQAPEHPQAPPPTPAPAHSVNRSPPVAQLLQNDRLQAILSMRPLTGSPSRPSFYPQQSYPQDQRQYFLSNLAQSLGNGVFDYNNNGYGMQQTQSLYNRNPYFGGMVGGNNAVPPYLQGFSGAGGYFSPAQSGQVYPQAPYFPFYSSGIRNSRDMDLKKHLESMASRLEGGRKIRNITCVMQELGYLNDKLEPNYAGIASRISRLPVPEELKNDMLEGVDFCRQFSMCLPETRKDKFQLSHDFSKPMSFFRCYKQKKLEACIMKDVRERYASARGAEDEEDSGESSSEEETEHTLRRSMASKKRSGGRRGRLVEDDKQDTPSIESSVFDFLYGAGDADDLFGDIPF